MPFNVNEMVVGFLLGDQKKVTEADVRHFPVGEAGVSIHHNDRRHFEVKFLQHRRPALRIRKQVMEPV